MYFSRMKSTVHNLATIKCQPARLQTRSAAPRLPIDGLETHDDRRPLPLRHRHRGTKNRPKAAIQRDGNAAKEFEYFIVPSFRPSLINQCGTRGGGGREPSSVLQKKHPTINLNQSLVNRPGAVRLPYPGRGAFFLYFDSLFHLPKSSIETGVAKEALNHRIYFCFAPAPASPLGTSHSPKRSCFHS